MTLLKTSRVYIAGHHDLVGSAIWKNLEARGYSQPIGCSHSELDLTNQQTVDNFFKKERPNTAVLATTFVGGIIVNSLHRADFITQSMMMQCNVISSAYKYGVRKPLFSGSTCTYPKNAPQPMKEDVLLVSSLEYVNEGYAIAKIAGLKIYESHNLQYGTNCIAMTLINLYGLNDNFRLENSHVISTMVRKIYSARLIHEDSWEAIQVDVNKRPIDPVKALAKQIGKDNVDDECGKERILQTLKFYGIENNKVTLRGTGLPLREFLWSGDMANASVHTLLNVGFKDIVDVRKYSSVFYGTVTDGEINHNNSEGRGGATPSLGEIRNCHINIGTRRELIINQLPEPIVQTVGFTGTVVWDESEPDGAPRKLIDVSRLHFLGWAHKVEIEDGVQKLYD